MAGGAARVAVARWAAVMGAAGEAELEAAWGALVVAAWPGLVAAWLGVVSAVVPVAERVVVAVMVWVVAGAAVAVAMGVRTAGA